MGLSNRNYQHEATFRDTVKSAFAYVTDERGFELARHSALSLAISHESPVNIHIFCYQFSPELPSQFCSAMADFRASLVFHSISDPLVEYHRTSLHVTTPSLLKLSAVRSLIDHYDQVAYLDNDFLLFDDLKIEDVQFDEAPLAAVVDMDLTETGALFQSQHSMSEKQAKGLQNYFNSGLMIFKSRNWRDTFLNDYAAALDGHEIRCPHKIDCTSIDQCALNSAFGDSWVRLPISYNMQTGAKYTKAWKSSPTRHYAGSRKFIPISAFRNDGRDVRLLNRVRSAMGLSITKYPSLYEFLYRLNAVCKYGDSMALNRFMQAISSHGRTANKSYVPQF